MHTTSAQSPPHERLEPDQLAASLSRNLSRSLYNIFSMPPLRAGVLGLITLGLFPLLRMRMQFRHMIAFERQQLWYFAELLRMGGHREQAEVMSDASHTLRYDRALHWMQNLCILAIVFVFAKCIGGHVTVGLILDRTFGFMQLKPLTPGPYRDSLLISFAAWNAGLALAYVLHWMQVIVHREAVAKALSSLQPRPEPKLDTDFRWPGVALLLSAFGGVWALLMAGAGAAQRRYINVTYDAARAAMLRRVQEISHDAAPAAPVMNYRIHGRRCTNPICRATLPPNARFCPRCGTQGSGGL